MSGNIEAKNITYLSEREIGEDINIVKEVWLDKNGEYKDNIRIIKNFERPFWITKPMYRKHNSKKESEFINKVNMYKSTDSAFIYNIPKALQDNRYIGIKDLRRLKKNLYLYGIDVDSRTILKKKYLKKYPDSSTPYRIGVFDIEVDLLTNKIIILTLVTKNKIRISLLKSYAKKIPDVKNKIKDGYDRYIPDNPFKNDIKKDMEIRIYDTEVEMIKWIFKEANYADVDFLTGWNIKYDIGEILERLESANINPADIFHYDKIPEKYKFFKFKEAKSKKVTEAGREIPVNPEEQWHTIKSTTNYYFIDAMASHRYVRVGGKTVPGGYRLDNILKYEGVAQKLKFDTHEGIKDAEWHIYMVLNKPLEYIIYNIWDNISILVLDNKTKDLAISVPLLSGVSHFDVFNSGPRKLVDALFFFYLEHGRVIGVKDPTEENDKILGLSGWIIALVASLVEEFGLKVIQNMPGMLTNIYSFVFDADVASAYPNATRAANVSKDTTHRELVKIQGFVKDLFMRQNINLTYGSTNSLEYCQTMFNMPNMFELYKNVVRTSI